MHVIEVTHRPPTDGEPISLAIGKFDGVHIGHQAILRAARPQSTVAQLAVMTLWPHPSWVLAGKPGYDRSLTPFPEKVRLLAAQGVERLYRVHFSREYAATPADVFVFDHLGRLNLQSVIVGSDFHFGQGGTAQVADLRRMCTEIGVPVTVVQPIEENGVKVSSSQIRRHLEHGRVEAAEALLGRPYAVEGVVVHGDARGRMLGFPTANLDGLDAYVLPATGVYAVSVEVCGPGSPAGNWFGVLNAGTRPTVAGQTFRLEVHLLGFSGDLYDRQLRVSFLSRIRDERKFAGLAELQAQIGTDVQMVRDKLGL